MRRVFVLLVLAGVWSAPAKAVTNETTFEARYQACVAEQDWSCAYDTLVRFMDASNGAAACLQDHRSGCAFLVFGLYTFGTLAITEASPDARRDLAEAGLRVLAPINRGLNDRISADFYFSTLKYVLCRKALDVRCSEIAHNAMLRQISVLQQHGAMHQLLTDIETVEAAEAGFGTRIDLLEPMKAARLAAALTFVD